MTSCISIFGPKTCVYTLAMQQEAPAHMACFLQNGYDQVYSAPMPKNIVELERQQEMARLLSDMDANDLDGAIKIIKEDECMADVDGEQELELDFDVLSPMTISKLDKYLRRIRPEGIVSVDPAEELSDNESSDDE